MSQLPNPDTTYPLVKLDDHPVVVGLQEKHVENAQNIASNKTQLDATTAQVNDWSSFFSTPVGKVLGMAIIAIVPLFLTWLSGKLDPKPIPVVVPITTPTIDSGGGQIVAPSVINNQTKIKAYTIDGVTIDIPSDLKTRVTVDPTVYPKDTKYVLGSKTVVFPCLVSFDSVTNKAIDVVQYRVPDDLINFAKGK